MTWYVAPGREIVAPAGMMEQASPAIARTLAAIPDHQASAAAVVIPAIASIPPERMYRLFGMAVEFAESSQLRIDDSDALDLWTLAAVVQVLCLPTLDTATSNISLPKGL